MASYKELLKQKEELERQMEAARQDEVEGVVGRIREAIDHYGLSALDLGYTRKELQALLSGGRGSKLKGSGVPAKYRNPETGQTWSGRGRMPNWMTPETAEQFLIHE